MFYICSVQWLSGERVGILYMVYIFYICTVQWLSGERVGILYMVYIYCVHVLYMCCTVAIWRESGDPVHGVQMVFVSFLHNLYHPGIIEINLT